MTRSELKCPAYLIAAVGSNAGKTSITLGLIRAFRRRGLVVQPFKCGPDYLDPTHLSIAAGRNCYNLDTWIMGEEYVRRLFSQKSKTADICIIEGAMGLFDGATADGETGTAAHISRVLDIPILLVLDVSGMGRSAAAIVHGCASFEPGTKIFGVIANQVGSDTHASLLHDSLAMARLPPLVGSIPKDALPNLPSRHLGLHRAHVDSQHEENIDKMAKICQQRIELDSLLQLATHSTAVPAKKQIFTQPKDVTIAVARDDAFHFIYEDNIEALKTAGACVHYFSPLADSSLPIADGLYIPGGYPELYAEALGNNESLRNDIRAFHKTGRPIYGECGGLMYLGEKIIDKDGRAWPMCGVLPVQTKIRLKRTSLGYSEVTLNKNCLWGKEGKTLMGHRFHYSEIVSERFSSEGWERLYSVYHPRSNSIFVEGYAQKNTLASYVHLHWASMPHAASSFIEHCRSSQ